MPEIAIGIDLGTSNSCVAVMRDGKVEVLANAYGEKTTASVVAFRSDGPINVGNAAKANIIHNPERTVHSSKRLIGRYFFSEEVKKARAICSYEIVEVENHALRIKIDEELFSLPEIAAMILSEMKSIAERNLGQPVTKAVITVPAYFNDNQRQATKDAGRIAGLEVLRIFNEPTAAALAYGFGKGLRQRVAVWDLGGGTFDISVLEIGDDVFEVLSTAGDTFLGGEDFDDRLIDLLAEEFQAKTGLNLRHDRYALEKLKVAAEGAKKGLSIDDEVEIRIPDVARTKDGVSHSLERILTVEEYCVLVDDLLQRSFKVCDEALQQAGVVARDLDGVILVGGPTRLPMIRKTVHEYFQQQPKATVDPDEAVAIGAAIQAASLLNPETEAYLLDVTPLSLRIGIVGGIADTVIERNTPVPIEQTRTFTTSRDGQESVEIRVYQGESPEAEANELLGQFSFSDYEKADRGDVQIDVTFEINTDGIVNVTATDRATGRAASTRITLSAGLSENEVQAIIKGGRTNRVETAPAQGEDVLGTIPLVRVPADTPVVFEETRESKQELYNADDDLEILDEELPAAMIRELPEPAATPVAEPQPMIGSEAPELAATPVAEPQPMIGSEAPEEARSETTPSAGDEARSEPVAAPEDELAGDLDLGDHRIPKPDVREPVVDPLPEDSLGIDDESDESDDLDLLDAPPEGLDEIQLDAAIEIGGRDEHGELTEAIPSEGVDPATMDTLPEIAKDDLFDTRGTDLSTPDDDDPEKLD